MAKKKTITLQTTNVSIDEKERADAVAKERGFGGVQDVIRLVIHDMAEDNFPVNISWGYPLSTGKRLELKESIAEYKAGKYTEIPEGKTLSEVLLDEDE